ncbi:gliding motility-associated ABC transporter ATP-binding subunit GldA [Mesonia maritima]
MGIEVKNITKLYGSQKALDNISFSVKTGEIVGFLGPNGAGKSTMMKILTGSLSPSSGTALINDIDIQKDKLKLQKKIGYLPEHNPLYEEMFVREYLQFNANVYAIKKNKVEEVIKLTGLAPEANKKIEQLSKGYRQRVGLANALLHNPDVLILDEPTTGLDPNQLVEIRKLIQEIAKNKTIFLSTHIMQEVEAICDRVIIINKGEIVTNQELKNLKSKTEQLIEVEFDFRVEVELLELLPKLIQAKNTIDFVYELTFDTQEDMRHKVFDFARDNELKILQLHQKHKNLEEIFRNITA